MLTVVRSKNLILKIILLSILFTLSITGCEVVRQIESGFGIGQIQPLPTAYPTVEPTLAPADIPPLQADQSKTLMLWVPPQFEPVENNPAGMVLLTRLQAFEEAHPDLKVEVRVKSISGESSLLNSLAATAYAAPEALPGLILLNRPDMETAALKSLIFPIPSRAVEYNSPDWFPFTENLVSFQGVQFGLPLFADPLVMAYNTQIVAFPPKTWQEILNQQNAVVVDLNDQAALLPYTIYLSAKGEITNDKGEPTLDPDALTRTYQTIYTGANSNVFPTWLVDLQSADDVWNAFLHGQGTYALVWASQALRSSPNNVSIAPVPGDPSIGFVNGWMFCITNPTGDYSRYDMMLADFLLETGFLAQWSESAGYIPAQRTVLVEWHNQEMVAMLDAAAEQSIVIPSNQILQQAGSILTRYSISLIRQQTSPMQAVLDSLDALEVK